MVDGSRVFRSLTAWVKKLLQKLALMLQNLVPEGRGANGLCEGPSGWIRLHVHSASERCPGCTRERHL